MQVHSTKQKEVAPRTPQTGLVDIAVVREGLAMVMDGLRVMENGKAKVSKSTILSDGKICLLPVLSIPGHGIGIIENTVMEGDKVKIVKVFSVDGISVMEKIVEAE